MEKDTLLEKYIVWRTYGEDSVKGIDSCYCTFSTDSGEACVREDFSEFLNLGGENEFIEISFDEMYKLEKEYEEISTDINGVYETNNIEAIAVNEIAEYHKVDEKYIILILELNFEKSIDVNGDYFYYKNEENEDLI